MEHLREAKLIDAMTEFWAQTLEQMRRFGYRIGHKISDPNSPTTFELILIDEPIVEKDMLSSRNGRCWFREPGWAESYWPYSDSPGVYLFFDASHTACYVGKAEVAIGYRASAHAGSPGTDGTYPNCAFPDAVYLISIPFDVAPFLSPSFESFLLSHFDFHHNKKLVAAKI